MSVHSKITEPELVARRNAVVALLREASADSTASIKIHEGIGWLGSTDSLIGFASKIPDWADPKRHPVSLYALLEKGIKPSLSNGYTGHYVVSK